MKYGFGVLATTLQFALQRFGLAHLPRPATKAAKLKRAANPTTPPYRKPCATPSRLGNVTRRVVFFFFFFFYVFFYYFFFFSQKIVEERPSRAA